MLGTHLGFRGIFLTEQHKEHFNGLKIKNFEINDLDNIEVHYGN